MVGSHGSIPHNGRTRRLLAVLALLALLGSACGSNTAQTTTAPAADEDAEYGAWDSPDASDDSSDSAHAADDDTPGDPTDSDSSEAPALGADADESSAPADAVAPDAPAQTAQVLAYAIQASEELSYSFEQGMSMQMSMLGMDLDISPDAAFVTGEVSGTDSRVLVDLGSFMTAMFESMDIDLSDPMFASVLGDFGNMSMEVWVVDSTMVIDMSSLAASMGAMDPAATAELSIFADGPVSVDLAALEGIGGTDAASLAQQFGQGAQVTDPAALIDALRGVDAVTDAGSSTVGDTPVTVYKASLSMSEYYQALDMDITDQLGSMESFGVAPGGPEAAMLESMLPALEQLTVDMTIMLDSDGLVRRIETRMDMGEMMSTMFGDLEGADSLGLGDIEVVVDTWQNFDDYGTDVTITAPAATDRTSELAGLIDS